MARFFYFIINSFVFAIFALFLYIIYDQSSHVIEVTQNYGTNLYEIIQGDFARENASLFPVASTFTAFLLMIYSIKSRNYLDKMVVFSKKGFLSVVLFFLLLFTYGGSFQNFEYEFIPEVIASAKKNGSLIFPYNEYETKPSFDRRINLSTDIKNLEEMLENNKTIEVGDGCYFFDYELMNLIEINADNIETVKGNFNGVKCYRSRSSSSSSSSSGANGCLRVAAADLRACVARSPESRWNSCQRNYELMLAGCSATE